MNLLFKEESYKIIGACMEVHRELGCGFLEIVYQKALEREFILQNILYQREAPINLSYKGFALEKEFFADFICFNKIIIELKSVKEIMPEHEAQVINYLKVSNLELGILVNFAKTKLEYKRLVRYK